MQGSVPDPSQSLLSPAHLLLRALSLPSPPLPFRSPDPTVWALPPPPPPPISSPATTSTYLLPQFGAGQCMAASQPCLDLLHPLHLALHVHRSCPRRNTDAVNLTPSASLHKQQQQQQGGKGRGVGNEALRGVEGWGGMRAAVPGGTLMPSISRQALACRHGSSSSSRAGDNEGLGVFEVMGWGAVQGATLMPSMPFRWSCAAVAPPPPHVPASSCSCSYPPALPRAPPSPSSCLLMLPPQPPPSPSSFFLPPHAHTSPTHLPLLPCLFLLVPHPSLSLPSPCPASAPAFPCLLTLEPQQLTPPPPCKLMPQPTPSHFSSAPPPHLRLQHRP